MRTTALLSFIALLGLPAMAQIFNSHSLTIGIGSAAPSGSTALDTGTALKFGYGHRFTRFLQFDTEFETSFNKDFRNYNPRSGSGLTTTTEYFVPIGGRVVVPVWHDRLAPSAGVGGVYSYDKGRQIDQHQGGVYGLGGISYAIDSRHKHRAGVSVRYMNMMSAGRPHPQWVNVFGEYTYSWGE